MGLRDWLYRKLMNAAARVARPEVRAIHNEVLTRGLEAAERARGWEESRG